MKSPEETAKEIILKIQRARMLPGWSWDDCTSFVAAALRQARVEALEEAAKKMDQFIVQFGWSGRLLTGGGVHEQKSEWKLGDRIRALAAQPEEVERG